MGIALGRLVNKRDPTTRNSLNFMRAGSVVVWSYWEPTTPRGRVFPFSGSRVERRNVTVRLVQE